MTLTEESGQPGRRGTLHTQGSHCQSEGVGPVWRDEPGEQEEEGEPRAHEVTSAPSTWSPRPVLEGARSH